MKSDPIHITAEVLEILPAVEANGNHTRQQILIATPNGKHDFKLAVTLWDFRVNTLKVGERYKFYLGSEPNLTTNGNYINNLTVYSLKKI